MTATELQAPVAPMLAKAAGSIPPPAAGREYLYEPKWDGFRCLLFVGDDVEISGRSESLTRYFPEVVDAVRAQLPSPLVLDGELVVARGATLDFEVLSQRIHPAESRVRLLAEQTPAWFLAFDLLEDADGVHTGEPFEHRRRRLEQASASWESPFFLTPATRDPVEAQHWFETFEGAGLDGVVAKPLDEPYQPGKRALTKVKHLRTGDCVVAGYRVHSSGAGVGSLLLGVHDDQGNLHHIGVVGSFTAAVRKAMVHELAPLVTDLDEHPWQPERADAAGVRRPGTVNRWNAKKDMSFVPLRPVLVAEVAYDQLQGDRFRHNPRFVRWRPDRTPQSCTFEQFDQPVSYDVGEVLRSGTLQ